MPNSLVADEADDVARPGFVDGLAFLAEELVRRGEAHGAAGALVRDRHVAFELARADAEERDAVAVLGSMLAWILKMKPENFSS
jgi:hypothetical protein